MKVLIVGGTRNVGHLLTLALLEAGHQVTVFNRGQTVDELPTTVTRIHGDRNAPAGLAQALAAADYDAVVDMVLYDGAQAQRAVAQLAGRTEHYLFISTGQVYLVREGLPRPFVEEDYDAGTPVPEPAPGTYDHGEWRYGVDKRAAEDVLARAWQERRFPVTTLRLPMVNSERDHFLRLYNYLLRIRDGGPILVPDAPQNPLRHVYGDDVARAILALLMRGPGRGEVFNISQDETISLSAWLAMLADCAGEQPAELVEVPRDALEREGLLPDCSPFSDTWMSELDNARSKTELGLRYTPLPDYLARIVAHHDHCPPPSSAGYRQRSREFKLANQP